MSPPKRSVFILIAAALPCAVLALFVAVGAHEAWLIATHQIAVIPTPAPGATSAPNVSAGSLVLPLLGSAALAAAFGYAGWRNSARVLLGSYLALLAFAITVYLRHAS